MKKILLTFSFITLVIGVAGCGKKNIKKQETKEAIETAMKAIDLAHRISHERDLYSV